MQVIRVVQRAVWCAALLGVAIGGPASAEEPEAGSVLDDPASTCMPAFEEGQRLRSGAQLVEARTQLEACSASECQAAIRAKCQEWRDELELEVPTVVAVVRDAQGNLVPDALVHVDGVVIPNAARGKPIEINPGVHSIVVEAGGAGRQQTVTVESGQKRVEVLFQLASTPPVEGSDASPTQAPRSGLTTMQTTGLVVGGIGVVGIGLFGVFAGIGSGQEGDLEDAGCEPRCNPDLVDDARTSYAVADVAIVVGLVALASGVVLFLAGGADEADAKSARGLPISPDGLSVRF